MHLRSFLILLLMILFNMEVIAQLQLDLEKIKSDTRDTFSELSYKILINEFQQDPASVNLYEATLIYYGRLYTDHYKPHDLNPKITRFKELLQGQRYQKALILGEEILIENPANLEVLSLMYGIFNKIGVNKAGVKEKADILTKKMDVLIEAILAHGSGHSESNTMKVVSVGDEYAMMGILGLRGKNRQSRISEKSALDIWKIKLKDGSDAELFVEVLVNLESLKD